VVGSNIFNLLARLGITATITPITRGGVSMASFVVMIVLAALLVPLMKTGLRISRWEGAGLLVAYAAYLVWLIP